MKQKVKIKPKSFSHREGGDVNQYFIVVYNKYGLNSARDDAEFNYNLDDQLSQKSESFQVSGMLGPWGTYFTLLKAYVGTACLYLPRNMISGGWLWSYSTVVMCGILTIYCTLLLIETSRKTGKQTQQKIGIQAYGKAGQYMNDLSLIITQCGLCCGYNYFLNENAKVLLHQMFNADVKTEWIALVFMILFILISYVRKIQIFAKMHIFADCTILFTLIIIFVYGIIYMSKDKSEAQIVPPVYLINPVTWSEAIGFSVYLFEGIGLVLPVQQVTKNKDDFPKIIIQVITTQVIILPLYGLFCILAWGNVLQTPLITDMLPTGLICWLIKLSFGFNLVFSYPLQLHPAHTTIESYLYSTWPKSKKRQCFKNLTRSALCIFVTFFTLCLGQKLDKFLSIIGSLSITPQVFILPCIFHYKLIADTPKQKAIDMTIVVLGTFVMVYCTWQGVVNWNR